MRAYGPLLQQRCAALQRLNQCMSLHPLQWGNNHGFGRPVRTSKQEHVTARLEERLDGIEHPDLYPHRPHADQIESLMQLRASQQLLDTRGFYVRITQTQLARGLTEECRLPDFGLHHRELKMGESQLQGNRR